MILNRLVLAIRTQNWFAVALEFVIVLAGVLLAFQISQLGQHRAEQARLEAQIGLIEAELRANLDVIRANIDQLETNNANLRELRVRLDGYSGEMDPAELNTLALYAFINPTLDIETFALERLEGMDGRQALSGSGVESSLRDWRRLLALTRDTEDNIDSLIVTTNAGGTFDGLSVDAMTGVFPRIGLVEPVPARFQSDWEALSSDRTFADHLAIFSLNLEYLWQNNILLEEATQDALDRIDERRSQ